MSLFTRSAAPVLEPMPDLPWASGAVFNPGAWYDGERIHLVFRAVPAGYRRIRLNGPDPYEPATGFDDYVSSIGYAWSSDGIHFQTRETPLIEPDGDSDRFGVEDPRIARLNGRYFIIYTALRHPAFGTVDGVRIALASTEDFRCVAKHGIVGPDTRDKDAVLFPRLIGGRIAMLHRITPDIQLIYFDDLDQLLAPRAGQWEEHLASLPEHVIMRPQAPWEAKKIGAGPTPIETEHGWLLIYHGVDDDHVYRTGMALLDLEDPSRILARTAEPVFEPETPFELHGDVDRVVFPTGAVVIVETLHIYYGAADRVIGHASAALEDVMSSLI